MTPSLLRCPCGSASVVVALGWALVRAGSAHAAPPAWGQVPSNRAAQAATTLAPSPADVTVRGPRISLGDLLHEVPAPWAEVDLGASPAPLQVRRITAGQIDLRLRQAGLAPAPVPLPMALRVTRAGTQLSQPQLRQLVGAHIESLLPPSATLRSLSIAAGAVVGEGALSVEVARPSWRSGVQTLMATVRSADGLRAQVPVLVDAELARAEDVESMARGQEIIIRVVVGSVLVQSPGTAQASGAVGDTIAVLPEVSKRVLRGRIIDGRTVEVQG